HHHPATPIPPASPPLPTRRPSDLNSGTPQVNTAEPVPEPKPAWPERTDRKARPVVAVLDTGLETVDGKEPRHPVLKGHAVVHSPWTTGPDVTVPVDEDMLDVDGDGLLERVAGHGTFIVGVVRKHAPDADIEVEGVLSSFGDGDDWHLSRIVTELLERTTPDVVNMSFGTYTEDDTCPLAMGEAVRLLREKGVVVVASAGNDATCRPAFPAAHPDVIAVGALDCHGPAAFTNH